MLAYKAELHITQEHRAGIRYSSGDQILGQIKYRGVLHPETPRFLLHTSAILPYFPACSCFLTGSGWLLLVQHGDKLAYSLQRRFEDDRVT